MTIRQQGQHFSMPRRKLVSVAMQAGVGISSVVEIALDRPWPNAEAHQAMLDDAPVTRIVGWLWDVMDAFALTQEIPEPLDPREEEFATGRD